MWMMQSHFFGKAVTYIYVPMCMHVYIYIHVYAFIHVCIWWSVHGEKYRRHTLGCSHWLIRNRAKWEKTVFLKSTCGASLVVQWLRICLPMQETRVRAPVWEDPTCHGATGPVSHNYCACASGACAPQQEAATVRGPRTAMQSGPRSPQLEKALAQKRRPNTAKNK